MGLISGAVTVHLSYVFGFEYANKLFSRGVALPREAYAMMLLRRIDDGSIAWHDQ